MTLFLSSSTRCWGTGVGVWRSICAATADIMGKHGVIVAKAASAQESHECSGTSHASIRSTARQE
jgi:hypothetical protein